MISSAFMTRRSAKYYKRKGTCRRLHDDIILSTKAVAEPFFDVWLASTAASRPLAARGKTAVLHTAATDLPKLDFI